MRTKHIAVFMIFLIVCIPVYSSNALASVLNVVSISGEDGIGSGSLGMRKYDDNITLVVEASVDNDDQLSTGQLKVVRNSEPSTNAKSFSSCSSQGDLYRCSYSEKDELSLTNVYTVRLYDDSGTLRRTSSARTITDKLPPTIRTFDVKDSAGSDDEYNITFVVEDTADASLSGCSGVSQVVIYNNRTGSVFETKTYSDVMSCQVSGKTSIRLSSAGTYNICIRSTDFLGQGSTESKCIKVEYIIDDDSEPEIDDTINETNTTTPVVINTTNTTKPVLNLTNTTRPAASKSNVKALPDQCVNKEKKTHALVDMMDNGIIKILEMVAALASLICTIWHIMNNIIAFINKLGCCVNLWGQAATGGCETTFKPFRSPYGIIEGMCCIATCGWCRGDASCDFLGINTVLKGVMQYNKIDPYTNIYTSIACICPSGILFNMRKLKTIYQTYNCCIEQACAAGTDVEACEKFLDVSTCMYWEGALSVTVAKLMMMAISLGIAKLISMAVSKVKIPTCILVILDIMNFMSQIQSVQENMKWLSRTFSEPECSELGFDKVKEDAKNHPDYTSYEMICQENEATKLCKDASVNIYSGIGGASGKTSMSDQQFLFQSGGKTYYGIIKDEGGENKVKYYDGTTYKDIASLKGVDNAKVSFFDSAGKNVEGTISISGESSNPYASFTYKDKTTSLPDSLQANLKVNPVKSGSADPIPPETRAPGGVDINGESWGVGVGNGNELSISQNGGTDPLGTGSLKWDSAKKVWYNDALGKIDGIDSRTEYAIVNYQGKFYRVGLEGEQVTTSDGSTLKTEKMPGTGQDYVQIVKKDGSKPICDVGGSDCSTVSDKDMATQAKKNTETQQTMDTTYNIVFMLFNMLIGETVYKQALQSCEDQYESSRNEKDEPAVSVQPEIDVYQRNSTDCSKRMNETIEDAQLYYYHDIKDVTVGSAAERKYSYDVNTGLYGYNVSMVYLNPELPKYDTIRFFIKTPADEDVGVKELSSEISMDHKSWSRTPLERVGDSYVRKERKNATINFSYNAIAQQPGAVLTNKYVLTREKAGMITQPNITLNIRINISPEKTEQVDYGFKHVWSYNVLACSQGINVEVYLKSNLTRGGVQAQDSRSIGSFTLSKGQSETEKKEEAYTSDNRYSQICIKTTDPMVPDECFEGIEKAIS